MEKMTSAYANKLLRKLSEDKNYLLTKENEGQTYVAALDEEPLIPEYDYSEVASSIAAIDEKIINIKHAINLSNATNLVDVGGSKYSVDMILVRMAQLNKRKEVLDKMRKRQPKARINSGLLISKKTAPEYQYINYDLELVKAEYDRIDAEISAMQLALDKYNQTVEFEVDI